METRQQSRIRNGVPNQTATAMTKPIFICHRAWNPTLADCTALNVWHCFRLNYSCQFSAFSGNGAEWTRTQMTQCHAFKWVNLHLFSQSERLTNSFKSQNYIKIDFAVACKEHRQLCWINATRLINLGWAVWAQSLVRCWYSTLHQQLVSAEHARPHNEQHSERLQCHDRPELTHAHTTVKHLRFTDSDLFQF